MARTVERTVRLLAFVALLAAGWDTAAAAHGHREYAPHAPMHRPGAADKGVFQLARDDRERQKGHGNGQDGAADTRRHDKPGGAGAERWQRLSPDEKERLKSRQRQFEKLSPDEQRRIREAEREYRRMSPEERQELRKKWERMSEEERARYRRKVDNKNRN